MSSYPATATVVALKVTVTFVNYEIKVEHQHQRVQLLKDTQITKPKFSRLSRLSNLYNDIYFKNLARSKDASQ